MSHDGDLATGPAIALPTAGSFAKARVTMRSVRPPAIIVIVAVLCTAVAGAAADEAKTSDSIPDPFAAAFGNLADRMAAKEGSRPGAAGRAASARSAAAANGPVLRLSERPGRTEDLEAALERLKATDRIGLRGAYKLSPDGDSLGLRIPLSDRTAIVPTYDLDDRDVGTAGTDGDRAHRFRLGASLRF